MILWISPFSVGLSFSLLIHEIWSSFSFLLLFWLKIDFFQGIKSLFYSFFFLWHILLFPFHWFQPWVYFFLSNFLFILALFNATKYIIKLLIWGICSLELELIIYIIIIKYSKIYFIRVITLRYYNIENHY